MAGQHYRPGYHFTPGRNWMSDPNGLVYFEGVYHLFFQHNAKEVVPGNMSWGHASSPDLMHWDEHPVAIAQDEAEQVYSGSVVVDRFNSAGFGAEDDVPLVAIYTSAYPDGRQAQSLAFSLDAGMTWTKYKDNPVLDRKSNSFRDPKVFWYRAGRRSGYWVMVAVEARTRQIVLYRSEDLKDWVYLSSFGPMDLVDGLWECPDLFPLPVDGDVDQTRWILVVSIDPGRATRGTFTGYLVGDFDGVNFTATADELRRLDWGSDLYAAVSFANAPNDRRILMGWMSNWNYADSVPTFPWRGTMSLPRELSLTASNGAVALAQRLPDELRSLDLAGSRHALEPFDLVGVRSIEGGPHYQVDVILEPVEAEQVGLNLFVGDGQLTRLSYDVRTGQLSLDRTGSGEAGFAMSFGSTDSVHVPLREGVLRLEVFVDRTSLEIFAQGGAVCMTDQIFAADESTGLAIFAVGGLARVKAFARTTMRVTRRVAISEPVASGGESASIEGC